jgi:plastocyanin
MQMLDVRFRLVHVLCIVAVLTATGCRSDEKAGRDFEGGSADTSSTSAAGSGNYQVIEVTNGGTITGRVTLAGDVPKLDPFDVTSDKDVCSPAARNNRLEVGPNGGVRYAVVYLDGIREGKAMPATPQPALVMDQQNCQYTPHVVAAPVGSAVTFLNSDPVMHNVRVEDAATDKIVLNRAQPRQGASDTMEVKQPGPFRVGCDYHSWMNAYIFGVENPYYAVTGEDGSFTIGDVPPGSYTVKMWFNGIRTIPRRDNQGKLVRYSFSDPYIQQKEITVAAGGKTEVIFQVTPDNQQTTGTGKES